VTGLDLQFEQIKL